MKERICRVLVFLSWTTAPMTGMSSAVVTTPCTVRVSADSSAFFLPWARRPAAETRTTRENARKRLAVMGVSTRYDGGAARSVSSLPVLLIFFFLFFQILRRFDLQRVGAYDPEIRPTLVTTDGVALVYILFIDIDCALAHGTRNHRFPPRYLL